MRNMILKILGFKKHICPNCKKSNYFKGKTGWDSIAGFCGKCKHPVWFCLFCFLMMANCKTYNIYTTDLKRGSTPVKTIQKNSVNRFEKAFDEADSVFMSKFQKP